MDMAVVQAQDAFSKIFGNTYPHSKTVERGLHRLLEDHYNGSQQDFTTKFVQPTLKLLNTLKAEGFPLTEDENYIIVHLVAPVDRLESSEMFFQVGRTTPGTLSLKFTKYEAGSGNIIQQPSEVLRKDYHIAFTESYLGNLRAKAAQLGDQLMRVLLVSAPALRDCSIYNVKKIQAKDLFQGNPSQPNRHGASHTIVRMPSQNDDHLGHAIHSAQLHHTGRAVTPEPVQVSDADPEVTPVQVSQSESMKLAGDQPIADAAEVLLPDPLYPPNKEGMSHSSVMQAVGSNANPKYPPASIAVQDEGAHVSTKKELDTEEVLATSAMGVSGVNLQYPAIRDAVESKTEDGRPNVRYPPASDAVRDSTQGTAGNPAYPPTEEAVKSGCSSTHPDCVTQGDANRKRDERGSFSRVTGGTQILYPPPEDGILCHSGPPVHEASKSLSGGANSNPKYPLVFDAVGDAPGRTVSAAGTAPPHVTEARNHAYPPAVIAVGSSSDCVGSNPKYPPIAEAVNDVAQARGTATPRVSEIGNPAYPPAGKAVGSSSDCAGSNPKYPPIAEAVNDVAQASTLTVAGVATPRVSEIGNPAYPPAGKAVESSSDCAGSNPKYPPIAEAVNDDAQANTLTAAGAAAPRVAETGNPAYPPAVKAVRSSSDCASSNHKYPPIAAVVNDDDTQGTLTEEGTDSCGFRGVGKPVVPAQSEESQGGHHAEKETSSEPAVGASFVHRPPVEEAAQSSSGFSIPVSTARPQAQGTREETADKPNKETKDYPDFFDDDNNSLF